MTYAAFDLETAKILPEGVEDIQAYRPLGITVGAIAVEGEEARCFQNLEEDYIWGPRHAQKFITELEELDAKGIDIISWNGLRFDLCILAEEAGWGEWHGRAARLAFKHYDLMFQVMCVKGYPVGLENACKGLGLAGKLSGVGGAQAPAMWAAGEREKVAAYCAQDCRATVDIYKAVEELGVFHWIANSGNPNKFKCPEILRVRDAMQLKKPYTGWMETPIDRDEFWAWTQEAPPGGLLPSVTEIQRPPDGDLPFIAQF
jgi:hypothetical protein